MEMDENIYEAIRQNGKRNRSACGRGDQITKHWKEKKNKTKSKNRAQRNNNNNYCLILEYTQFLCVDQTESDAAIHKFVAYVLCLIRINGFIWLFLFHLLAHGQPRGGSTKT